MKAIIRAAQCCKHLNRFSEGKELCDKGLQIDPKEKSLLEIRTDIVKTEKEVERNKRKREKEDKAKKNQENKLIEAINKRQINIVRKAGAESDLTLDDIEPSHPAAIRKKVHFSTQDPNILVWPVLFIYPEFGETDFIEEFGEDELFIEHISVMFEEQPPWDAKGDYKTDNLKLYFEDTDAMKLIEIDVSSTLGEAVRNKRYKVHGGTPAFIVLAQGNEFQKDFLSKYK